MRKPFDDLLDEMTELTDADEMQLEARVTRLERVVQKMLLAFVEENARGQ
jgi:hypothetical protein